MARPPYHGHGFHDAAAAGGAARGRGFGFNAGSRAYAPPSFFLPMPVGGHASAPPSLAAYAAAPFFAAEGGQGDYSPPFLAAAPYFAAEGGRGDYGPRSLAAAQGQTSMGGPFGLSSPRFPDAGTSAPARSARWGPPIIPAANHGVAMDAGGSASNATSGGPLGRSLHQYGRYDIDPVLSLPRVHNSGGTLDFDSSAWASATVFPPVPTGVPVMSINRDNAHFVFKQIKSIIANRSGRMFIALDLEYAAAADTKMDTRPRSLSEWYTYLKEFVDSGCVVQIGMAFAFDTPTSQVQAYEINLYADIGAGSGSGSVKYSQDSIDFLTGQGHMLEEHRRSGVLPEWVFADLLRHIPFNDSSVTWVTFHADRDLAFLMNLCVDGGRGLLPNDRVMFMHEARRRFPLLYDCRVLAQIVVPGFTGSLKSLADNLGISRTGQEHFAGSDALVTLGCFAKLLEQCQVHGISAREGLLSGAEELEMSIRCAAPVSDSPLHNFEMTPQNYQDECAKIYELVHCNFRIIALQVTVPEELKSPLRQPGQELYGHMMLDKLNRVGRFEVDLCFMNVEALIAYGRVWKFTLDATNYSHGLARLLASSGATHDPSCVWVTIHGAQDIACMIKCFMAPVPMPHHYEDYLSLRRSCFPSIVDLALVSSLPSSRVPTLPTGCKCKGGISHLSRSLGVPRHERDVVTMLRCYDCFKKRGALQTFVPGDVMDRCCSTCTP